MSIPSFVREELEKHTKFIDSHGFLAGHRILSHFDGKWILSASALGNWFVEEFPSVYREMCSPVVEGMQGDRRYKAVLAYSIAIQLDPLDLLTGKVGGCPKPGELWLFGHCWLRDREIICKTTPYHDLNHQVVWTDWEEVPMEEAIRTKNFLDLFSSIRKEKILAN